MSETVTTCTVLDGARGGGGGCSTRIEKLTVLTRLAPGGSDGGGGEGGGKGGGGLGGGGLGGGGDGDGGDGGGGDGGGGDGGGGHNGGDGGDGGAGGGAGGDGGRPTTLSAVSVEPLMSAWSRIASVKSMVESP